MRAGAGLLLSACEEPPHVWGVWHPGQGKKAIHWDGWEWAEGKSARKRGERKVNEKQPA